jgi:glycine cleavage system H lipoate-binding protein
MFVTGIVKMLGVMNFAKTIKTTNMKSLVILICTAVFFAGQVPAGAMLTERGSPDESVRIRCSPDLYAVVKGCADTYMNEHGTSVTVESIEGDLGHWVEDPGNIALVTKGYMSGIDPRAVRVSVIGREVYVPVMNPGNPYREEILRQGISPADFAALYAPGSKKGWDNVLENGSSSEVVAYRIADPSFISYLSDFTNTGEGAIKGTVLGSCEAVVERVKMEKNAVGFCTLNQLLEMERTGTELDVLMIPVDLNNNGKLDHFEQIYGSVEELARGIWIGKYSGTLYSRIFAVTSLEATSGEGMNMIRWMLGEGQEILASGGYAPLMEREREVILASLETVPATSVRPEIAPKFALPVAIAVLLALAIILYLVLRVFNSREPLPEQRNMVRSTAFVSESSEVPGGYNFDRSHTWTFMERDGRIRVGIDCFLQKITGPVTKVDMKSPGEKVKKGETVFALIQHGKKIEVKSPLTGVIREFNDKLMKNASLLNTAPFSDGWVYLVEPTNWMEEFGTFMNGTRYRDWIKQEFIRLKDFLAEVIQPKVGHAVVLQDGGEVQEGVLKDFGPEVWEDFQSGFLRN